MPTVYIRNGQLHRANGPAITDLTADLYFSEGRLHRTDGPAIVFKTLPTSYDEYWVHGVRQDYQPILISLNRAMPIYGHAGRSELTSLVVAYAGEPRSDRRVIDDQVDPNEACDIVQSAHASLRASPFHYKSLAAQFYYPHNQSKLDI
jgi:hypothetical protein